MIIPIISGPLRRQAYLICLSRIPKISSVLRTAKVRPGTYAGELISNLHDGVFHRSVELKSDYTNYYASEYATFGEYASKRFLFNNEVARQLAALHSHSQVIYYFNPTYCFLEEDYGRDFLERLFDSRLPK